jgi:AcrR family transcriptional regulator
MQTQDSTKHDGESQQPATSTRQWLIEVARREISERGFTGVSMRSITARADVDPSLVRHYFGSKQNLLAQATNVALDSDELVAEAVRGTAAGVGRRTVKMVLGLCDNAGTSARALVGFAVPLSSPEEGALGDDAYLGGLFRRIAAKVSPDRHELRAALVTTQITALVLGRYLVRDPVLAAAGEQDLVRTVGRTVQDFLTGPLPAEGEGDGDDGTPPEPSGSAAA